MRRRSIMNVLRFALGAAFVAASPAAGVAFVECGPGSPVSPDGGTDASLLDSAADTGSEAGDAGAASDAAPTSLCPHPRFIAFDPSWTSSPCPTVLPGDGGVWTGSILFSLEESDGGTLSPEADSGEWDALPGALKKYCAYTWQSDASAPEDPSNLKGTAHPDCEIVSPVDSFANLGCDQLPGVDVGGTCTAMWKTAVAGVEVNTTGAPGAIPIRVDVVDTTRTGDTLDPGAPSPHGNAIGAIVNRIACGNTPSPSCAVSMHWQLGLPHLQGESGRGDFAKGGKLGTPAEVAVATWASMQGGVPAKQSIINLSVGWAHQDCLSGGPAGAGSGPCASERAALDAMKYAECAGALVFAAAGNASSLGSTETGPLYPAGWEGPDSFPGDCTNYDGSTTLDQAQLYAVGGVDYADHVLANARPGARPRLAAYGNGVTVPYAGPSAFSPIMTGTSIAASVASGVAAALWSKDTSVTAANILQRLYDKGSVLDAGADFPPGHAAVHRISYCATINGPPCAHPSPLSIALVPVTGSALAAPCAATACPSFAPLANPVDQPWGYPQPGGHECGGCMMSVTSDGTELNASFDTPPTSPAVVVMTDADGGTSTYVVSLDAGDATSFQVSFDAAAPVSATISVSDGDGGSTLDPIFVVPADGGP
jgi:hypothetical protein